MDDLDIELDTAKVGDGASMYGYSDVHAGTIIKRTDKKIWIKRDTATLLNGNNSGEPDALTFQAGGFLGHTSGIQRYDYSSNPDGETRVYSRRSWVNYKGDDRVRWAEVGSDRHNGPTIGAGRHEHYDFNF